MRDWEEVLTRYARLQRLLVARVDDLLELGVPDARTHRLPDVSERVIAGLARHASPDRIRRIRAMEPRMRDAAAELAGSGVPDSLDHADVHDGQILVHIDGTATLFDWGDASVAHPFESLRVPLERARRIFGAEVLPRLRDAYLSEWSDLRPVSELRAIVRTAWRCAAIARAGSWGRLFPGAYPGKDWGREQIDWLTRFDEEPPPEL